MPTSFSALKKNRKKSLQKAKDRLDSNAKRFKDDRFWKPTLDKDGMAQAVIRFLPEAKGDDTAFVQTFSHFVRFGKKKVFGCSCPTTIKNPCPVCEDNSLHWDAGNKEKVSQRKRQMKYISNIYVVKDPANPDNEGKVFLFKYGSQIFNKLKSKMIPEEGFEDEELNPFDFWDGCSIKIKVQPNSKGYSDYTTSEILPSKPLSNDEEKLKEIWESEYSLKEFIDPEKYESYDDLKNRYHKFLMSNGEAPGNNSPAAEKTQVTKEPDSPKVQESKSDVMADLDKMLADDPKESAKEDESDDEWDEIPF